MRKFSKRQLIKSAALAAPALVLPSREIIKPAQAWRHGSTANSIRLNSLMTGLPGAQYGINYPFFFDDFLDTSTIDVNNTQAIGPYNWYLNNIGVFGGFTYNPPIQPANPAWYSVANSILTVTYAIGQYGNMFQTLNYFSATQQLHGTVPPIPGTQPFYIEGRFLSTTQYRFDWWIEDWYLFQQQVPGSALGISGPFTEYDISNQDYGGQPGTTFHVWPTASHTNIIGGAVMPSATGNFELVGLLHVPAAYNNGLGFMQPYLNRSPIGAPEGLWSSADEFGAERSNYMIFIGIESLNADGSGTLPTPWKCDYVLVGSSIGPPVAVCSGGGSGSPPTVWNASCLGPGIAVAQDGLTLTSTNANSGQFTNTRTNISHATGKYYAELTVVLDNGVAGGGSSGHVQFGFGNAKEFQTWWVGNTLNSVAYAANIVMNNVHLGAAGAAFPGATMGMAIDIDAKLVWFQAYGVNWNGSGSADPATGTGGISFADMNAGPYYAMCGLTPRSKAVANFGGSAYTYTPPAGFGNW